MIEVCVDSLESALIAREAGADQVELVSDAGIGGLTPSAGLLREVLHAGIRTMAMIRPRGAGFCYSAHDRRVMLADVAFAREMGAHGVVFGALREDRSLDEPLIRRVVEEAGDMEVVFHRAFEVLRNPVEDARRLASLGICRVLTKGGANTLAEGQEVLRALLADGALEIISGGVRLETIDLIHSIGLRHVHLSSTVTKKDPSTAGTGISYGRTAGAEDEVYALSDGVMLRRLIEALRNPTLRS